MKNLVSFLSFFLFVSLVNLQAKETPVTPANFVASYNAAEDGDILLLASGSYTSGVNIPTGKIITLKADEGASPILNFQFGGTTDNTGGGLILENLEINRGEPLAANYFISGNPGNIKILSFKNVTITNLGRSFLRTDTEGYVIDEITFENCVIKNCGINYNFLWPKHIVKKVSVKNSTLYNYIDGESFFCPNNTAGATAIDFVFENNTVYKWSGATNSRSIVRVDNRYNNSNSTYTFRNNIIAEHYGAYVPTMINLTAAGTVIAENNLIVNYGGYTGGTQTINDLTLAGLGLTTIGFPDPDNGDFTILSTSPLATAGTDGGCIGDPRWIKTMSEVVNLSTNVSPEGAGNVVPIAAPYEKNSLVTVTATPNYGYRFKEWQNASGQTVSTDNPYSFSIIEDTELTAVFIPVPVYTLTVNTEGDGAEWGRFKLTPEPVNGVYEAGTSVNVSIVPNSVSTFLYWDDQTSQTSRQVIMDDNKTVTATFDWIPFLVAWNFDPAEPRNNRSGDFYSRSDNNGIMRLFNGDGSTTNWGGSTKTFGGITYTCARRYTGFADMSNPRYFQAEFSAKAIEQTQYSNVRVTSFIGSDNVCVHKIQKMQYATNPAGPYIDLKTIDMTPYYNTMWVECSATLPEEAIQAEKIYIRWIGDTNSELLGTPSSTDTEGFYLANVVVYADIVQGDDPVAPALVAVVPGAGTNTASANGSIVLTFDKRVKAGVNDGKIDFNGETLTPVFSNRTVSYPYRRLSYGTPYTVTIPAGIITNMSDVPYGGSQFVFTTMTRPQPAARLYDAVVDINGTGDYVKVQDAINAAPTNRSTPWLIFIKNGRYEELLRIPNNKPFIHLIGEDKDQVTLTWCIHCGDPVSGWPGASQGSQGVSDACAAFVIDASDFYAENISFENRFGVDAQAGPQAMALKNNRDRLAVYNCKFRSFQDTWQTSSANNRIYACNCWIEGAVDYFYGGGNAYIESSTLYNMRSGAVIVAPSHTTDTKYGYIFQNCIVDGIAAAADGQQKLGRPWQNSPRVAYLNTTMNIPIAPEGWSDMGAVPALFAEYNSMDKNGNPIDLRNRKTCYTVNGVQTCGVKAILTAEEAAAFTYEAVVNAQDDWNPRAFFEAVLKPANIRMTDNILSWDVCDYAICYVIYKNDRAVSFTVSTSYEDASATDTDTYSVRPVNEFGSLGEMSDTIRKDGSVVNIQKISAKNYSFENAGSELIIRNVDLNTRVNLYNISGQLLRTVTAASKEVRFSSAGLKGVYIVMIDNSSFKIIL